MGDPLVGRPVLLDQPRTLKFTFKALRICQKRFGGRSVRDVLSHIDVDVVCEFAAAGFIADDPLMSADKVEAALDRNPERFEALSIAVIEAVTEAYARMRSEEKPSGEVKAPAQAGATTEVGPTSPG